MRCSIGSWMLMPTLWPPASAAPRFAASIMPGYAARRRDHGEALFGQYAAELARLFGPLVRGLGIARGAEDGHRSLEFRNEFKTLHELRHDAEDAPLHGCAEVLGLRLGGQVLRRQVHSAGVAARVLCLFVHCYEYSRLGRRTNLGPGGYNQTNGKGAGASKVARGNGWRPICRSTRTWSLARATSIQRSFLSAKAPRRDEDIQKRPFVGRGGQLLRTCIRESGFKEEDVYITNIVKRRPPDNRDPLPEEIEAYKPYLTRQIEIIAAPVIVTLGRFAMNCFLPCREITRDQGTIFRMGSPLYIVTHAPPGRCPARPGNDGHLPRHFSKLPKILRKMRSRFEKEPVTRKPAAALPPQKPPFPAKPAPRSKNCSRSRASRPSPCADSASLRPTAIPL